MKNIIIGNSVAGIWAAEYLRKYDRDCEITIVSDEPEQYYSRCLLPNLLNKELSKQDLIISSYDYYDSRKIELITGKKVTAVIPQENKIILDNTEQLVYDQLLIGTGASPSFPEVPGIDSEGVLGLRTLSDAYKIMELLESTTKVVILGAGLISLKIAYVLNKLGLEVTMLVTSKQVLSQVLDPQSAKLVQHRFEQAGVKILFGQDIVEVIPCNGAHSRVKAIKTTQGEKFDTDLVIVGKGVHPNINFLKNSGINCDWGVIVDRHLRTNLANVYAAGDVAETEELITRKRGVIAIWTNAAEQGKIAGINMAGKPRDYPGALNMNSIEFYELPVISLGISRPRSEEYEQIWNENCGEGCYQKLVLHNDVIVGAILIRDISNAGPILSAIRNRISIKHIKPRIWQKIATVNLETNRLRMFY